MGPPGERRTNLAKELVLRYFRESHGELESSSASTNLLIGKEGLGADAGLGHPVLGTVQRPEADNQDLAHASLRKVLLPGEHLQSRVFR